MKWRSEIDYHGSQPHGAGERPVGQFASAIEWIANVLRRAVRKLESRPVPPTVLIHDGRHSFSLLGADTLGTSRDEDAACPFPLKAMPADRRDWRVLP
jgi:hypothetical protein